MIKAERVTKRFDDITAVDQVTAEIKEGNVFGLIGTNGAGKSTMLKCFNHIITPDAGEVRLNGENLLKMSAKEVAKRIAFVAQKAA